MWYSIVLKGENNKILRLKMWFVFSLTKLTKLFKINSEIIEIKTCCTNRVSKTVIIILVI